MSKMALRVYTSTGQFGGRSRFYRPRNWPVFSGQFIGLVFQADSQASSEADPIVATHNGQYDFLPDLEGLLIFALQRPSHVVFPKIGISRFFWDFTQKS